MLVMVCTALQFVSFAFTPQTLPSTSKEFRDAVDVLQNIVPLTSADVFDVSFVCVESAVVLLLAVMVVQERVEFAKFWLPDAKAWKYTWLAMSTYANACVTIFFIPIAKMLLRAIDCTDVGGVWSLDALYFAPPAASSAGGSVSGDAVGLECWTGGHWAYVASAAGCFLAFVAVSVRLLRVGGDLGSQGEPVRLARRCNEEDASSPPTLAQKSVQRHRRRLREAARCRDEGLVRHQPTIPPRCSCS
jgi:hypothetical protein